MSLPWMKFYTTDWMGCSELRSCSAAARGVWIDMLCIMAKSKRVGYLTMTTAALARMVGESSDSMAVLLAELEAAGVFSRDGDSIYCRRMVRDAEYTERMTEIGKRGGNPKLGKGITQGITPRDKPRVLPDTRIQNPESRVPETTSHTQESDWPEELKDIPSTGGIGGVCKVIAAEFPPASSLPSAPALRAAVTRLATEGRFPDWIRSAAFLRVRIRAYAQSPWAKSHDGGKFLPGLAKWLEDERFDDPDSAWARERPKEGAESNGRVSDEEYQRSLAEGLAFDERRRKKMMERIQR